MRSRIGTLVVAAIVAATSVAPAASPGGRSAKWREISGRVIGTKVVDVRGTAARTLVVLIATTKRNRRVPVDVGEVAAFEDVTIDAGDLLEAEGRVITIRGRSVFVARRVRIDGEVVQVIRRKQQKMLETTPA